MPRPSLPPALRRVHAHGWASAVALGLLACATDPGTKSAAASPGAVDADGDGSPASVDCDDTDPTVSPTASEVCGGGDEDCDGEIDEDDAADAPVWYPDADGDGFGDLARPHRACVQPADTITVGGDCDDTDALRSPAAAEIPCNGVAESCSGDGGVRVPEDAATLQLAVDAAEDGGFVCVGPGTWDGARVTRPVHIVGVGGPESARLDGRDRHPVLDVEGAPGTTLEGLSFDHGADTFGAGVRLRASDDTTIVGCRFDDNVALADGGALSIEDSDRVRISTNVFDGNAAEGNGGAVRVVDSAEVQLASNTFTDNRAGGSGGAVWLLRTTDTWLTGAELRRNLADTGGALAAQDGSGLRVDVLTVADNEAATTGGAVALRGEADPTLDQLVVEANTAPTGAGVTVHGGSGAVISASQLRSQRAVTYGGCLLLRTEAVVHLSDSDFTSCSADGAGGGVAVREAAHLTVERGSFTDGFGGTGGGVALLDTGTVEVTAARFVDNTAATHGGALAAEGGRLVASEVVLDGNLPEDSWCAPSATCTISTAAP